MQPADGDDLPEQGWVPPRLPTADLSNVTEALQTLWAEQPEAAHDVVIMLTVDSEATAPESIGLKSFAPIAYQPGMFKATMSGADLLSLAARPEVEEIVPDEDVTAL